jgi:hypothetical protein
LLSRNVLRGEAESMRRRRSLSRARESRRFAISDFKSQINGLNCDLRSEICYVTFLAKRGLFPTFVLGEVIVDRGIALDAPYGALFVPFPVEGGF